MQRIMRNSVLQSLKRFWRDELGAEVIQFVLVLPIMLGLMWTAMEAWQLMTLRAAVRSTTAQAARYMTAFGASNESIAPMAPEYVCAGVEYLVAESLSRQSGNLGDHLVATMRWYRFLDPTSPLWEGNAVEVSCMELLLGYQCNDTFAVALEVAVPWQTVIFGLNHSSTATQMLRFSDSTVGIAPCLPNCSVGISGGVTSGGVYGCQARMCWTLDCSYKPDFCAIFVDGRLVHRQDAPMPDQCFEPVTLPLGDSPIEVRCYGGQRKTTSVTVLNCGYSAD
jgi:hypothetical protein